MHLFCQAAVHRGVLNDHAVSRTFRPQQQSSEWALASWYFSPSSLACLPSTPQQHSASWPQQALPSLLPTGCGPNFQQSGFNLLPSICSHTVINQEEWPLPAGFLQGLRSRSPSPSILTCFSAQWVTVSCLSFLSARICQVPSIPRPAPSRQTGVQLVNSFKYLTEVTFLRNMHVYVTTCINFRDSFSRPTDHRSGGTPSENLPCGAIVMVY